MRSTSVVPGAFLQKPSSVSSTLASTVLSEASCATFADHNSSCTEKPLAPTIASSVLAAVEGWWSACPKLLRVDTHLAEKGAAR